MNKKKGRRRNNRRKKQSGKRTKEGLAGWQGNKGKESEHESAILYTCIPSHHKLFHRSCLCCYLQSRNKEAKNKRGKDGMNGHTDSSSRRERGIQEKMCIKSRQTARKREAEIGQMMIIAIIDY